MPPPNNKKVFHSYFKLPGKIFTLHCRSMSAIKKTYIHKSMSEKNPSLQEMCQLNFTKRAPIARNIRHQIRSRSSASKEQFLRNEAPDNSALQPIVFTSNSPTSTETFYSNIERQVLGILHGLEIFHHTALPVRIAWLFITNHWW